MAPYINYLGEEIGLINHKPKQAKPKTKAVKPGAPVAFHKGWRVIGVSPQVISEAREDHKRNKQWDEAAWLMTAKQTPLRMKPYALRSAADQCAAMAAKNGWMRVEILEVKQGETPQQAAFMSRKAA